MGYGIDEKEKILFERELEKLLEKPSSTLKGPRFGQDLVPIHMLKRPFKKLPTTSIEPEQPKQHAKIKDPYLIPPIPQPIKPILKKGGSTILPPPSLLTPSKRPVVPALAKPEIQVKQPAISKVELPKVTFPKPEIKQAKPFKIDIPITKPDLAKIKVDVPKVGLPSFEKPKKPALQITPSKIKIDPKKPVVSPVKIAKVPQLEPPPSGLVGKDKFVVKIDKQYVLKMDKTGRYYRQNIKNPGDTNWIKYKDAAEIIKKHQQAAKSQDYKPAKKTQANKQVLKKTGTGDAPEEPSKKLQQKIDKAKDTQTVKDQSGKKKDSAIKTGIGQSGEKFKKAQQAKLDAMAKKQLDIDAKTKQLQAEIEKQAKTLKAANNEEFTDKKGVKHTVPKRTWKSKIGGGLRAAGGIGMFFALTGLDKIAMSLAADSYVKDISKEQDTLPETDVRKLLTPMQFNGGYANTPLYQPIPFTPPKDRLTTVFVTSQPSKEQFKELTNSWTNMSIKNRKDIKFSDDLIKDNLVRMMIPNGTVQNIHSKRLFDLYNQPGTVMQIIPTHEYEGHPDFGTKRKRIERMKIGTSNVSTLYISGEQTAPTGIYHDVSTEEEEGGTKIDDEGNVLYIPMRHELRYYENLINFTDEKIEPPADWYAPHLRSTDDNKKEKEVASLGIEPEGPEDLLPTTADTTLKSNFVNIGEVTVDEDEIKNVVNSTKKTRGAPSTQENYEELMRSLSIQSGVPIKLLKTLGATESLVSPSNLTKWKYRGDQHMGKEGSFGIFHVRWGIAQPGAVNDFNIRHGTKYTWRTVATDPLKAATIGAWYFSFLLKKYKGNVIDTYAHYTSGSATSPKGRKNAKRFMKNYKMFEGINFSKKSAILEGMSKVNI